MEQTVENFQIRLTPESLDEGADYEKATFGALELKRGSHLLTSVIRADSEGTHYDKGPRVSGYHLAEWLTWNWWRLRWEPRPPSGSAIFPWDMAHRMSDIGEGYVWPNITISCDGLQCDLFSRPSRESDTPLLRYLGADPMTIAATAFETAVDQFVVFVLQELANAEIKNTNLHMLWEDLTAERHNAETARFRRMEALLGFDPDVMDNDTIDGWLRDAQFLGENATEELATAAAKSMLTAGEISDSTKLHGSEMSLNDAFRLNDSVPIRWGHTEAWSVGIKVAQCVRQKAELADKPIIDSRLAELAGVSRKVLTEVRHNNSHSWIFHAGKDSPHVILRNSAWKSSRRFDLARLIGDRLFSDIGLIPAESLTPATRSYSYRQKAQRAFAAGLLSPWDATLNSLNGDHSVEKQEQVARYFDVSPVTISSQIRNNKGYDPENWAD